MDDRKRAWDYYIEDPEEVEENRKCKCTKPDNSHASAVTIHPEMITNAPTLKIIASVAIASSLWNHVNIPRALSDVKDTFASNTKQWTELCEKVRASIADLKVANPIAEQIAKFVGKMTTQINEWVSYHYRTVFLENGLDKFVYYLAQYIDWYPNGRINRVQTARKLKEVTSLRFGDMEKFRFLSVYCLEDEMDRMEPEKLCRAIIYDHPNVQEYPMVWFWHCFYTETLPRISLNDDYETNLKIYANIFIRHPKVDNWAAKRYFFNLLNSIEQELQAIWLIDEYGIVYQKAVLLEMNEEQRHSVYRERATQIILNYARPRINATFILRTWEEAKGLMTEDQFLTLIRGLLSSLKSKDSILLEIWSNAGRNLKLHVVDAGCNDDEIVENVLMKFCTSDTEDREVSRRFKKNCIENDSYKKFLKIHGPKLLSTNKFKELEQSLKFFLPDAEDLQKFKVHLVTHSDHVKKTCFEFYSSGQLDDLNNYLNQLLDSNPDDIAQYKQKLIKSPDGFRLCVSLMDISSEHKLNRILNDAYKSNSSISKYRKNMIFSTEAITKLRKMLENSGLLAVQACINLHLTNLTEKEDKAALKKQLIGDIMELMLAIFSKSQASYFQQVLMWSFENDEDAVEKFRNTIQLDTIFIDMMKNCVFQEYNNQFLTLCRFNKRYPEKSDFNILDEFLNWYFWKMPGKKHEFMMRIIRSFREIEFFKILQAGKLGNRHLKAIIRWFFKNNVDEIENFKKYAGGRIAILEI